MANVKISELPVATSLSNGDSFPVVQGGVTKQAARSVLFASPTFTGATTADLLTATGDVTFDGGAFVFNESGADKDARFEGDTDANLLFLDASTNRIGVGTATPAAKLDVNGSAAITGNVTLTGDVVLANDQYLYWGVGDGSAYVRGNSSSDYISFGTVGVERMRLDSSGNLGVGTSSPSAKLHVAGTFRQNDATSTYGYTVTTASSKTVTAALFGGGYFAWQTNASGTDQLTLDSSGNLGLGVTPSAWSGVVAMQLPTGAALTGFSNTTNLVQNAYYNGSWRYISTAAAALSQVTQGAHQWFTAPSGTAGNAISFTQMMTLDASGNLGIGTSSPAAKLDVNGPASVTSFTGSTRLGVTVKGSTAATDYSGIDFSGNNQSTPTARIAVLSAASGSSLVFGTSSDYATGITNTALTIDFLGNLISRVNNAAPTLSTNSTMSFELTSNTSLRIVVRGTDGTTRSVSLTLA